MTRDSSETNSDIIVAGSGPAGLTAALAMAHAGFSVTLVGPAPRPDDRRTTALMMPALAFLGRLGVLDDLLSEGAPLRAMRIVDATSRLVRSPAVTFRSSEIDEEAFGYNIPNKHLNDWLEASVLASKAINWRRTTVARWSLDESHVTAELADGGRETALLVVAADGRSSPAREAAGITVGSHRVRQSALVLNFAHSRDHAGISTEFHTETGPFTQVPLPGRRSSLVWVVRPATAEGLAMLDNTLLASQIEERMQSMLGKITVEEGRQVYPLASALPSRFARNRVALVGEAAHVFPPIGAQGLNLGIRDVEDLVETALLDRQDPGSPAVIHRYDAKRRPDVFARSAAVNMLNLSLLSDFLPAQLLRSAGLGFLSGIAPARSFFMREGLRPGSGWRNLLADMRRQLHP